jgi:hypothetical protein
MIKELAKTGFILGPDLNRGAVEKLLKFFDSNHIMIHVPSNLFKKQFVIRFNYKNKE